jgi:hypothetical protein
MALLSRSGRPLLASFGLALICVALTGESVGFLMAFLKGIGPDVYIHGTNMTVYLALLFAVDARWPPADRGHPRADDREGPPIQSDVQ